MPSLLLIAAKAGSGPPVFEKPNIRKDLRAVVIENRCTGNPAPTFTWKKGTIELKARVGKYELKSTKAGEVFVETLRILVSPSQ